MDAIAASVSRETKIRFANMMHFLKLCLSVTTDGSKRDTRNKKQRQQKLTKLNAAQCYITRLNLVIVVAVPISIIIKM